jgi:hypothetical protein
MEQDHWVSRETAAPPGLERSNELQQAIMPLFQSRKGGFSLRGMYGRKIWAGAARSSFIFFFFIFPHTAAAPAEGAASPQAITLANKEKVPQPSLFLSCYWQGAR